jgi:DNA-binding transcriptional LysR family regulator
VSFRFQNTGQVLRWPFCLGERTFEVVPQAGFVIDSSDAVLAALAAGAGVGVSPTYLAASHVRAGLLVPVLTKFAVERASIAALWSESRRSSPNVRAFLNFLYEVFPSPTPWDNLIDQWTPTDELTIPLDNRFDTDWPLRGWYIP